MSDQARMVETKRLDQEAARLSPERGFFYWRGLTSGLGHPPKR